MISYSLSDNTFKKVLTFMDELSITDDKSFREEVLFFFERFFGFRQSTFWLLDEKYQLHNPLILGVDDSVISTYYNYLDKDILAPDKLTYMIPRQRVISTFDVLTTEEYENSKFYKGYMEKHGFYSSTVLYLVSGHKLIGLIGLSFSKDDKLLTQNDLMCLEVISRYLGELVDRKFHRYDNESDYPDTHIPLTPREKEVSLLVKQGCSNKEISQTLYISVNTVKKHVQSLYEKFHVNNRTQLSFKLTSN